MWKITSIIKYFKNITFDMDGVLCEDPPPDKDFGMPGYEDHLRITNPIYIPNFEIYQIVTGRREKYRRETLEWLFNNNVKYKRLVLKPTHIPTEKTPYFKANIYINSDSELFIESNEEQSKIIAMISKKPVYYFKKGVIYNFA